MRYGKPPTELPGLSIREQGQCVVVLHQGAGSTLDHFLRAPLERLGGRLLELDSAEAPAEEVPQILRDAGQVVVVGSPRGIAKEVNFYDHLHRRYIEVTGAHGNMLFEPAHARLAGAWGIDKAQTWLLAAIASGRLNLDGLVTHTIRPEGVGQAYEGLLKDKDNWLGVVVDWS